jgi:hypothetical protein
VHPFSLHTVVQSTGVSQAPRSLQVDTWPDSHFIVPGVQVPVHAPLVHRYGHVASDCQVPPALHTRSMSPMQSLLPGAHGAPCDASLSAAPSRRPASGGVDPASDSSSKLPRIVVQPHAPKSPREKAMAPTARSSPAALSAIRQCFE